jgi:hypothetical protein
VLHPEGGISLYHFLLDQPALLLKIQFRIIFQRKLRYQHIEKKSCDNSNF